MTKETLTVAEANELLRSVRVDRFPIVADYKARVGKGSLNIVQIEQTVLIRVPDRDDPTKSLDVRFGFSLPCRLEHLDRRLVLKTVREALHSVVTHEMDECLLVDGVRVFDPHAFDGQLSRKYGTERRTTRRSVAPSAHRERRVGLRVRRDLSGKRVGRSVKTERV